MRKIPINITADFPETRSHDVKAGKQIRSAGLSPTGARAVFEARGEILTVPAEKGDIRNLTNTPAAAERDPAWSPDGKWLAYFSDESGEYELHVPIRRTAAARRRRSHSATRRLFFYNPVWSPDARRSPTRDKRLQPVVHRPGRRGKSTKVDTHAVSTRQPAFRRRGRRIAMARPTRRQLEELTRTRSSSTRSKPARRRRSPTA